MTASNSWSVQRVAPIVALLALVPVSLFLLAQDAPPVALALLNVVIIATSVFLMLSSSDRDGHATH